MDSPAPYIVISGSIAVGKSTLAENLGKRLSISYLVEPYEENPFIDLAYEKPEEWSFMSQMFFLAELTKAHQQEIQNSFATILSERSIYESFEIFTEMRKDFMSPEEYDLLEKMYSAVRVLLRSPDLIIYLHAPAEVSMENIQSRGRKGEALIQKKDLEILNNHYEKFIEGWDLSPIIPWNTGNFDLRQKDNLENLVKEIRKTVDLSTRL